MALRDRLDAGAAKLSQGARDVADSGTVRQAGESLQGLRALFKTDVGRPTSIERFLVALVRAVREDDRTGDRSTRDVFEAARRRRRRLGVLSLGAGPLVGAASHVVDLYCETAVVCDLEGVHHLGLSDESIAAHMLVLWSVTDTLEEAESAIAGTGERSVAAILSTRLRAHSKERLPETLSRRSAVKALWDARAAVGEAREGASSAIRGVAFTGRRTKQVIRKAERQLGVR